MSKHYRLIIFALLCAAVLLGVLWAFSTTPRVQPSGGSIEFDGRVIDLDGASSVVIESEHTVTDWGDVTVTTSAVTITVWRKP